MHILKIESTRHGAKVHQSSLLPVLSLFTLPYIISRLAYFPLFFQCQYITNSPDSEGKITKAELSPEKQYMTN